MNVVTALNETYVPYTYVMLYSLFENNINRRIQVFLLQEGLTEESRDRLERLGSSYQNEIRFVEMNREMFDERLLSAHEWSMETCFRLAMNNVLPEELDRLIYLDGDMIINKDISDLYDRPFPHGKHLIVTHDMTMTPDSGVAYGHLHTEVFNRLIRENRYFNAGMILMDYAWLRKKYGFETYMKAAEDLNFEIYAPDQDLLNLVHENETDFVDALKYDLFACNAAVNHLDYEKVKKGVSIIHYVGEKPWQSGNHFHYDVEKLWWDYASRTDYASSLEASFLKSYYADSEFYDAIIRAENMNRELTNDLNNTILAFGRLYRMLSGKDADGLLPTVNTEEPHPDIPPKNEGKPMEINAILDDHSIEAYVSLLRRENEELQKQLKEALEAYNTMKDSTKGK